MDKKTCGDCGESKSTDNWPKQGNSFRRICRDCHLRRKRESNVRCRKKNLKKRLAYERQYRKDNKEKIKSNYTKWRKENREHFNEYHRTWDKKTRRENPEKAREKKKKYAKANPEKIALYRKRVYEKKKVKNPTFFLIERIKRTIRLIITKNTNKNHTTLFYTGCKTIEEFLEKMTEKTLNKNWLTDGYEIDHIMQRHWFNEFLLANPDSGEQVAEIMSHYSNLRPLSKIENTRRSQFDVSFVNEDIFNRFSKFWNKNIIDCARFYLDKKHLFSGERIEKLSEEEDILFKFLVGTYSR